MWIIEEASSSGSAIPQSPGRNECHGRRHPSGSSPHASSAAIPFKPVVHVHTTLVIPGLPQLQVPGTSVVVDRHKQHSPRKDSSLANRDRDTVHGQFSDGMGGIPQCSSPGPRGVGPGDFIKEPQLVGPQSHITSNRSLPSDVGSQIGDDSHGQHSVRIQSEEGRRNSLSRAVLYSLGHSHEMSESPDPPSCPASESTMNVVVDKLNRANKAIPTEWCMTTASSEPLPDNSENQASTFRHLPQQETANIHQTVSESTSSSHRRAKHGLEQSSHGLRIPSDANSAQGASEDQDVIMHHHSDSASLANSVLVSRSPQSIHSNPVNDPSVPGTPVPSGGLPDVVPQNSRNVFHACPEYTHR